MKSQAEGINRPWTIKFIATKISLPLWRGRLRTYVKAASAGPNATIERVRPNDASPLDWKWMVKRAT
ncbi:MAG: hypothetical protein IPM54_43505 [Polyangiaceae bacterium]|nr:hypothetical protein [Polyangiaceae bacterium]